MHWIIIILIWHKLWKWVSCSPALPFFHIWCLASCLTSFPNLLPLGLNPFMSPTGHIAHLCILWFTRLYLLKPLLRNFCKVFAGFIFLKKLSDERKQHSLPTIHPTCHHCGKHTLFALNSELPTTQTGVWQQLCTYNSFNFYIFFNSLSLSPV